jgi:ubiquinone/menaquinone biosynthesis C-methylase UbiE
MIPADENIRVEINGTEEAAVLKSEASSRNRQPPSDWTVWQDAEIVAKFIGDRRSGILGGAEQLEVLCQLLPQPTGNGDSARVLDLGCGDGILLETVLHRWPGAQGVALDGSSAMLAKAATRLAAFPPSAIHFVQADFNAPEWMEKLPYRAFDAIVSGFAIHHSEDERKHALYAEIYTLLRPGGLFANVEHVASASPHGEQLFEHAFALNLTRTRRAQGKEAQFEEVLNEIANRLDKSANRLTPVETQLQWLRAIGYTDVDCYWKHYELAILAGYKPQQD